MKRWGYVGAVACALAISGCGDVPVEGLRLENMGDSGSVLVDNQGYVLYLFEPDQGADLATCTGTCARHWPPVPAVPVQDLELGSGVDPALVGSATSTGGDVLTYNHWPLYRYDADKPGESRGHGIDLHGGKWFALNSSGEKAPTK